MSRLNSLLPGRECEWLDLKLEFHANKAKLLHDILCLANANHDGDRFIVFGVSDDKVVHGVGGDSNRRTNADLHDFLRQVNLNRVPKIELATENHSGHEIDILKICNTASKPYFLTKDYRDGSTHLRAGAIYTRLSDTNIPPNESAPEDHVEIMWRERLGLLGNKTFSLEEDFPIKIGDSRDHVRKVLGEPDATGFQIEHFYTEGIEISYDLHTENVDGLIVYHLPSGTAFEGTVFGLKLGDSFARVKNVLGKPDCWSLAHENSSLAIWERDEKLLCCEIWRGASPGEVVPAGTVKAIYYCNRKSYVGYVALVAIALEQMRRQIQPSIFERPDVFMMGLDKDDPVFFEPYEFLGGRPAMFGGSEVLVAFTNSKTVIAFWVYPLGWQDPVIRGIYKLSEDATAENGHDTSSTGESLLPSAP